MDVTKETLNYLAKIARLELNEEEKEPLLNDLNRILSFVEQLKEVNTDGVEPLVFINNEIPELRPDIIQDGLSVEDALKNAPVKNDSFFLVPKVIG
jgi:aspartyl-tRNA(Asn)/glutamyl-tRNA(Gln) amidotransferase subunit C